MIHRLREQLALDDRPTARAVALFCGLNLSMILVFTLLAPSSGESGQPWPLFQPVQVTLRVLIALGTYALVVWSVRPGERTRRERATLALAGLGFTALLSHYYAVVLPLAVVPLVARYWLSLGHTALFTALLLVGSVPLWSVARPLTPATLIIALGLSVVLNGYTLLSFEFALREARAREEVRELSELAVRHAEVAERTRLSRELHDTLGHHLTAQRFDLQLLRSLIGGPVDVEPERPGRSQLQAPLGRAVDRNAEALTDLRRAVKALRPETLGGRLSTALEGLLDDWPLPVTLSVQGQEPPLSAELKLVLYRAAQEALTNARKHAGSAPMTLSLAFGDHEVSLCASNPAAQTDLLEGGGLHGLRERARDLGGELSAALGDDTFTLRLRLPLGGPP